MIFFKLGPRTPSTAHSAIQLGCKQTLACHWSARSISSPWHRHSEL